MIYSKKHNFIFIHIPKNAGTSVAAALIEYAAPDWQVRLNQRLNKIGISFLEPIPFRAKYSNREWISKVLNILYRRYCNTFHLLPMPYRDHINAAELIQKIGIKMFENAFSFAIVRNPWAQQVSRYNYIIQSRYHYLHREFLALESFDAFIFEWLPTHPVHEQWKWIYSKQGELLVDYVAKQEQLVDDFEKICHLIKIPARLPYKNRSGHKQYKDYYSKESRAVVEKLFARDIKLFEYSFEE